MIIISFVCFFTKRLISLLLKTNGGGIINVMEATTPFVVSRQKECGGGFNTMVNTKHCIAAGLLAVFSSMLISVVWSDDSFALTQVDSFTGLSNAISSSETEIEITADFTFTGQITVPNGATITIDGKNHTITRDSSHLGGFISVPASSELVINNMNISGGATSWYADLENWSLRYNGDHSRSYGQYPIVSGENDIIATAALINNSGKLELNNSSIKDAHSNVEAAAIKSTGDLAINNSEISHNGCDKGNTGGAIYFSSDSANISIENSTLSSNNNGSLASTNGRGGAIYVVKANSVDIKNNTISQNSSENDGGALYIMTADAVSIEDNSFTNNTTGNDGSCIKLGGATSSTSKNGKVSLKNNTYDNNLSIAYYDEEGIGNAEGVISDYGPGFSELKVDGDAFTNNKASFCTAMCIGSAANIQDFSISNAKLTGNSTALNKEPGDLLRVTSASVAISNSEIKNNKGYLNVIGVTDITIDGVDYSNNSGNVRLYEADSITVRSTSITDNAVSADSRDNVGAALTVESGGNTVATVANVTVSNNKTAGNNISGAGIALEIPDGYLLTANIVDSIIENNETGLDGGGIMISDIWWDGDAPQGKGIVTVSGNTVIKGNKAGRYGGGLAIPERALTQVKIDSGVQINGNTAGQGGDDIYYAPFKDGEVNEFGKFVIVSSPDVQSWYLDVPGARYSQEYSIEAAEIDLTNTSVSYLKAIAKEAISPENVVNPATDDHITSYMMTIVICLSTLGLAYISAPRDAKLK